MCQKIIVLINGRVRKTLCFFIYFVEYLIAYRLSGFGDYIMVKFESNVSCGYCLRTRLDTMEKPLSVFLYIKGQERDISCLYTTFCL